MSRTGSLSLLFLPPPLHRPLLTEKTCSCKPELVKLDKEQDRKLAEAVASVERRFEQRLATRPLSSTLVMVKDDHRERLGEGHSLLKVSKKFFVRRPALSSGYCPADWGLHAGNCFRLFPGVTSFDAAELTCIEYDAHLASLHNMEELHFVQGIV